MRKAFTFAVLNGCHVLLYLYDPLKDSHTQLKQIMRGQPPNYLFPKNSLTATKLFIQ